jgi:hypothetical protein
LGSAFESSGLVINEAKLWAIDNPNTQQTLEYTKDKYNVKMMKRKVSPKVSPTTCVGRRLKVRKERKG